MTPQTLRAAELAAKRFLEIAKLVQTEKCAPPGEGWFRVIPGKESAAAKRASLDLTRALADMRRVES